MKKIKIVTLLLAAALNYVVVYGQWNLTGNAGTNPPTNFLGTTDQQPLVFKVNNLFSGLIDYDANKANTVLGHQSLISLSTGIHNSGLGFAALYANTSGGANTAVGTYALTSNQRGWNNSAFGAYALTASLGNENTAVGTSSLTANSSGSQNCAIGYRALYSNTTGNFNTSAGYKTLYSNTASGATAIGYQALYSNSIGTNNTATGYNALYSNSSGSGNTANGYEALSSSSTGSYNVANGHWALKNNTSGEWNLAIGSYSLFNNTTGGNNIAVGYEALYNNTNTGDGDNVAVGQLALYANTTGKANTAMGLISLWNNTTGVENTAVGSSTLTNNTTGIKNTALGINADVNAPNYSFTTMLGEGAVGTGSNMVRVGSNLITSIGGYANWTNISDKRVKRNIQTNVPGLDFINKLSPVTYNLDLNAADAVIQPRILKDKNGKAVQISNEELTARKQKEQITYTGFIAQEVESAAKSIGYDFSGVDVPKNDKDLYGLRYSEFVVPLVKAVQELSTQNDKKEAIIADLNQKVDHLQSQIDRILKDKSLDQGQLKSISVAESHLEQNSPNPFNVDTKIRYFLSTASGNSSLVITNVNGQVLKTVLLKGKENGEVIISSRELTPGIYFYSLILNGNKVDTKEMVITK